ncbi:hypothetical protein [Streptomyces sp. NPDC058755]|uniref:hypothetical protein n=1 Tax=Streptomyces sp. NPDC058755 TaxID=3346624 RepID=UPI00367BCACB
MTAIAYRDGEEIGRTSHGNPHNVDSFKQPRRHTWHGQALVILRPARLALRVADQS